MKKLLVLLVMLSALPFTIKAQNCSDLINYRRAKPPYRYNTVSKSAMCMTGRKYEFVLPMTKGIDYRLQFMASPIFNRNIDFKIVDLNTGETVLDLPGKTPQGTEVKRGSCVLEPYASTSGTCDQYFDFYPTSSTSLKIIIDVKEYQEEKPEVPQAVQYDEWGNEIQAPVTKPVEKPSDKGANGVPAEFRKGCVAVYVTDKVSDSSSF